MLAEMSPSDIEEVFEGAAWRDGREDDRFAKLEASLLRAAGVTLEDGSGITPEALLGRELLPRDPRLDAPVQAQDESGPSEKAERTMARLELAKMRKAARGKAPGVVVSPPKTEP